MLGIKILIKKYPPTAFVNGYPNIVIFYSGFSLAKNRRQERLSRVYIRYRKTVGESKDIGCVWFFSLPLANHLSQDRLSLVQPSQFLVV